MATDLIEVTNADRRFYPLMGPFLSNREVVRAVGDHVWDDDTKTWLVLRNRKVLGFVAVAAHGNRTFVESLYTQPGLHRVASELVGAAVARFGGRDLHAVVKRDHVATYLDSGFTEVSETARFVKLIRKA